MGLYAAMRVALIERGPLDDLFLNALPAVLLSTPKPPAKRQHSPTGQRGFAISIFLTGGNIGRGLGPLAIMYLVVYRYGFRVDAVVHVCWGPHCVAYSESLEAPVAGSGECIISSGRSTHKRLCETQESLGEQFVPTGNRSLCYTYSPSYAQ